MLVSANHASSNSGQVAPCVTGIASSGLSRDDEARERDPINKLSPLEFPKESYIKENHHCKTPIYGGYALVPNNLRAPIDSRDALLAL